MIVHICQFFSDLSNRENYALRHMLCVFTLQRWTSDTVDWWRDSKSFAFSSFEKRKKAKKTNKRAHYGGIKKSVNLINTKNQHKHVNFHTDLLTLYKNIPSIVSFLQIQCDALLPLHDMQILRPRQPVLDYCQL